MDTILRLAKNESKNEWYSVSRVNFDACKTYRFANCDNMDEIKEIRFAYCDMPSIPKIVNWNEFSNLYYVDISHCDLQTIKKADLMGLEKIGMLWLAHNKLEFLPGDLLDDMVNLKDVSFASNKIKCIDEKLIGSLKKLNVLNLTHNISIDRYYDANNPDSSSLESIVKDILEKCKVPDELNINKQASEGRSKDKEIKKPEYLLTDVVNLLKNSEATDITVTINDRNFRTHKFLLMARSPVFFEMLKKNPSAEQLNFNDIPADIFKIILKFMYQDVFPPDDANFKDIFDVAGRLKIEVLKDYAGKKLMNQVTHDNAIDYLMMANKYEHNGLRSRAFAQLRKTFPDKTLNKSLARDQEKILKLNTLKRNFDKAFNELQK